MIRKLVEDSTRRAVLPVAMVLLMGALLVACAQIPAPKSEVVATVVVERDVQVFGTPAPVPEGLSKGQPLPPLDRMIIRTGHLELVVKDISKSLDDMADIAKRAGGYVSSSSSQGEGEEQTAYVVIRIPKASFEDVWRQLRALAVKVTADNISTQDVTEEYTDLDAHLRNLEASEEQYLILMKKAEDVEDMVAIQDKLTWVRDEIERIKGRMNLLERSVEMATISVQLRAKTEKPVVEPGWAPLQQLRDAARTLVNLFQWLSYAVIWLIVFAGPIVVIIGAIIWGIWRLRRTRSTE